ncbi:MAG: carbon-nitrogen hydrolase family protein [Sphingobacteriaceae bacterium]
MTNQKSFKVAMVQMSVQGNNTPANLATATRLLKQAAAGNARVAILPECMDIGWTHPGSLHNATAIPDGVVFQTLSRLAKELNMFICSGLTEKDKEKTYNSAVLIDNKGHLLLKHRKINELDIGKPYYALGDRINVIDTELGRLGIMICADAIVEDKSITTALARMGTDIILSPCAWAVPPGFDHQKTPYGDLWRDAYSPIAKKFSTYIIGVSNVGHITDGPWKGWDCIGASIAIDKNGVEMVQMPFGVAAEKIEYIRCDQLG